MSRLREENLEQVDDFDADSITSDGYAYDEEQLVDESTNQNNVDVEKTFPIRRASSCNTYCGLCDANNPNVARVANGGFALRKVASCSLCTWDIDERMSDNEEVNLSEDEDRSFERTPLKRSNSYSLAMDEIDMLSEIDKCNTEMSVDQNEDSNSNVHSDMLRLPPDGGESSIDELENCSASVDQVNDTNELNIENSSEYNNNKNNNNSNKKEKKSKSKKHKNKSSKNSLDNIATQELDDIFGRISRTPDSMVSVDDDDKFSLNLSNENFTGSLSSGKKSRRILKRLLPPRSLFSKRQSNLTSQKSRSVEYLYTNDYRPSEMLHKSLSTIEIASCGIDNQALYEEEFEVDKSVNEKWITYLNRIGGMSVFGGNQMLRYVWHQIDCYQNDILQPFEDVVKNILEELQQAYMKCQEMDSLLIMKTEQQEKETSKIYEDMEQVVQLEREQMHEKHAEKEEQTRTEYTKLLELKEQEIQELLKKNLELVEKNEKLQSENVDVMCSKENIESQISQLTLHERQLRNENEALVEEKSALVEKIKEYDGSLKELQDHVIQRTKMADLEKENYKQCLRRYQDLVEEKEFLDVNISNLSSEIEDLRIQNKSLLDQQQNWTNSSIHYERAVSPIDPLDDNFDVNSNTDMFQYRAASPENMANKSLASSIFSDSQISATPATPLIQTPNGLTPLRQRSFDQSKNILTSSPRKQMYKNSVQTPIRLASSNQTEFKVIFTGDVNVGKTSLIRRICHNKFRANREVTYEADYLTKVVEHKDQKVRLKLWDTVGQERFNSIPPSYFRKSDVVILMYDIEEDASFFNAKTWIRTIHDYTTEHVFLVLVANKSDLHHKRRVQKEKGELLAKAHDAMYVETSAKTGENVNTLCDMIASTLLEREDTVFIRNNFENSLCSLSYSKRKLAGPSICCQ